MSKKTNIRRAGVATAAAGVVAALAFGSAFLNSGSAATGGQPPSRPKTTTGVNVTPTRPDSNEVPKEMFDQPFVDGRLVGGVADANRELPFRTTAPTSLGAPAKIFLHGEYRPQAVALVYDHPVYGRIVVTQEPIDMPEELQRRALAEMAAACDPATGCVGSWTTEQLSNGNRALLISSPPEVNAVVWIHAGGIRYQLMGPGTSLGASVALAVANVIEAAAS